MRNRTYHGGVHITSKDTLDCVFINCRQNVINSTPICDPELVVVSHLKKKGN
jgi:hypothetical protein